MKKNLTAGLLMILILLFVKKSYADSGGTLKPEQAAYDVKFYSLNLNIDNSTKSIDGWLLCRAEIVEPINSLLLDLSDNFTVDSVLVKNNQDEFIVADFTYSSGYLDIIFPDTNLVGFTVEVKVFYNGMPQVSENPPWGVGFVWETTSEGKPWLGVTCEEGGADVWWPCKDHPSDEPDSMRISFTVSDPLMCVSNGRFLGSASNGNNTTTYNWFVSTPINNYDVTFYAAEYKLIEDTYKSISGNDVPFYFWVLPEDYDEALEYMDVFRQEFDFLESINGPFPFASDKHGWAEAPYWGMEHQTIIAYGNHFMLNSWGLDYIHYHEMSHEWWGNFLTAADWSDVWIHEGMATYTEALYVEHLYGIEKYHQYLVDRRPGDDHPYALAPRRSMTATAAFDSLNPYLRGAWVLNTLRFYLGDELFFKLFKSWAYLDSNDVDNTNGRLCRIVKTDDMKVLAESITGKDLDNFFEVFFRQKDYPQLRVQRYDSFALFQWVTEGDIALDLNVPIEINGQEALVKMENGEGTVVIDKSDRLIIDPDNWILMASPIITSVNYEYPTVKINFKLEQNYPNPFNPKTTITYSLPKSGFVTLKIYDLLGREVTTLVNEEKHIGTAKVTWNAQNKPSGIYFYKITAVGYTKINKMILLK